MTRRDLFSTVAAASVATAAPAIAQTVQRKGRLKQGVCRGVFGKMDPDTMYKEAARLGAKGVDLVGAEQFPLLKKYGLIPTMLPSGSGIRDGINRKEFHEKIEKRMREDIDLAAQVGAPNVIVLSGERKGMSDAEGADNCVAFFNKIKGHAEAKGVTLCMELLNSKVNHPDYMCDHTAWGVDVCKRVNSPRVKLLYDIYHMQIMEGDIIRTIRQNIAWIGHFHTAGNPGRNQFDEGQELNYVGICKAIVDLGYQGFLCHEYSPKNVDPIKTLDAMISICDV